ncbi:MAG: lysozyme [Betaproteobacteria bacterium]|nr:lysozyme [Betaproteobacteria bacterium]
MAIIVSEPPEQMLDLCRRYEGLRLKPYLCPAGIPTVGYGHTGQEVRIGGPAITLKFAEELLYEDARTHYLSAMKSSPCLWLETDGRRSAIGDFCFNLGPTRYRASILKRRIEARNWVGAVEEIKKWVFGGGKKLPGLVLRRGEESGLLKEKTS